MDRKPESADPAGSLTKVDDRNTGKLHDWTEVLGRLVGLRLAVYDDVVRLGAHADDWGRKGLAHHEAVEWLVEHRLLARDHTTGTWRAVPIEKAKATYESQGPGLLKDGEMEGRGDGETSRAPVQPHQAQFFDMEGYR